MASICICLPLFPLLLNGGCLASVTQAGEYKKQKSQHSTLSDMDILMEQQYNSEQHTNLGTDIGIEDGKEESEKNLANHCECSEVIKFCDKVVSEEIRAMKEKQDLVGMSLQKSDQVMHLLCKLNFN